MTDEHWHFWVDRGGTFTDVVARGPDGGLHRLKLLSEAPGRYADAAAEAMRRLTGTPPGEPLPACELRLGTTVATNALLERKGEATVLVVTRGFAEALTIGTQERPDLFARAIRLPEPVHAEVIEVDERVTAGGEVLVPLDEAKAREALAKARERGFTALAIALVHGWRHNRHEAALVRLAIELGFTQISASHRVAPLIRLIPRASTAVADAYLSPVLARYVDALEAELGPSVRALYMRSGGSLASAEAFHGKDAVLSGPAGGIVALAAVAREADLPAVVGFDMGGTSTDVSWYSGRYERESETRLGGLRLTVPMMRIHTVAAGGGSICGFDGTRLTVGPESAGAVPGPACYRRGGPLTVTDCNLLLGRLQPEHFPQVFGPEGDQPLDPAEAEARMDALLAEIQAATGRRLTRDQAAEGFLEIAVSAMAHAIKAVSLRRGHDVTRAALVSFGGAGGQHACAVAEALGMERVLCHPLASLLSAWGMGLARRGALRQTSLGLPLTPECWNEVLAALARLGDEAEAELSRSGVTGAIERLATLTLRPEGSENTIELPFAAATGPESLARAFAAGWHARFGYRPKGALVVDSARIEALAESPPPPLPPLLPRNSAGPVGTIPLTSHGQRHRAPLFRREDLAPGWRAEGPALIVDPVSTILVAPGWSAIIDEAGNCLLTRESTASGPVSRHGPSSETAPDPIRLEVMGALFMAVAEEMGAALQHSASSVNIRERLDFSCAVFDRHGNMVANAPHMPVHLGSMGEAVRAVLARRGPGPDGAPLDGRGMRPGDAYALNAPYAGGTHLPDITVIMPVFAARDDAAPAWYVAARGHHADVGGISPGSMPPDSRTLAEEGVILENLLLVEDGTLREEAIRAALAAGPHPARDPDRNLADLAAQIAACRRGADELLRVAAEQGRDCVDAYMEHVQVQAEQAVRRLIGALDAVADGGMFTAPMDNGARISVKVTTDREAGGATIDFTGTSPQLPGNFNAGLPVARAAVLYVLRCLIDTAMPMNEGCLRPIRLIVPAGSMLRPGPEAAVVAGNVETSQVLCDALFAALGGLAASQGTMNNLTFGDASHQYYETIAGGAGAGPGFPGASAVQTHMTNSRLTDPEILETQFPVLLEAFSIRRGSGGAGRWHGGDGAVRRLRFLKPMRAGILSNRRSTAPFGLAGGGDGLPGLNRVERADGSVEVLAACAALDMAPGDVLVIETPGGGGYGAEEQG